uniref:Aquaporin n=1 Tax=Timema bartmani TaxID=61472 RepID=A0A7R9I5G7_9NEOP|nr:unnamed protein product [Timema bartmani]
MGQARRVGAGRPRNVRTPDLEDDVLTAIQQALTRSTLEPSLDSASFRCNICTGELHEELTLAQAVVLEGIVTSSLVLMACSTWDVRNKNRHDSIPLKFGFFVTAIVASEAPYTGAHMNPARSLGPALWSCKWDNHWKVMPEGQYYTCSKARKQLENIDMDAQQPSVSVEAEELEEDVVMPQTERRTEEWDDSYVTSFE